VNKTSAQIPLSRELQEWLDAKISAGNCGRTYEECILTILEVLRTRPRVDTRTELNLLGANLDPDRKSPFYTR
jgi:hypothetical protein